MELQGIANRVQSGQPLTESELALLLSRNPHYLSAFMIENNAGNVNFTLRNKLGYTNLSFEPNLKALARQMDILIAQHKDNDFTEVLTNFRIDQTKISPALYNELVKVFSPIIANYKKLNK